MKNFCTLFLVVLYQFVLNSAIAFQSYNNDIEKAVDSILSLHTGSNKPGATIGIIKDGKLIFHKGYGMADLKTHQPNDARVVYTIASCSKQFTAAIVVSLIQQQKLALTDNINKYLPEFPDYGKVITIKNLLYHTSGIRDYMVLMWLTGKSFEEPFTNKDAMDLITRQRTLNFNPGDRCVYSNSNYILLAEIVQRISGNTLAQVADQGILKTLGMRSSGFDARYIKKESVKAISYYKAGNSYLPFKNNFTAYGDGGMHTTLEDIVRWDKEFYDTSSLVQPILKRGKLNNGALLRYGMGIIINTYRNELIQTHPGAFLGFRSEILRFPAKKISVICLGNSEDINPESISRAIADVYVFGDKNTGVVHSKTDMKPIRDQDASAFTGIYEVAPNVLVHIRHEDGLLSGQVSGQSRQMLYADSSNTFNIGYTSDKAVFQNLIDGKFQHLVVRQLQGVTTAQRLNVISAEDHSRYEGTYYSQEQNISYRFYRKDGVLWFSMGNNAPIKAEVLQKYNRLYFDYKNLEQATLDFSMSSNNIVNGFILNSGRVSDIHFVRK